MSSPLPFTFTQIARDHMDRNGFSPDDLLGTIPHMLSEDDPAGAVDQIDRAYKDIGGGWHDSRGHELAAERGQLIYTGDRPRQLLAEATLRDERILFFNGAWIAVVQPDGSFRVARID
jgi:hypothetical protein